MQSKSISNKGLEDDMNELKTAMAVAAQQIVTLEKDRDLLWLTITKAQDKLNKISNQISAFGVVNALILGWIAWKLTRGI